jgi:polyferredoxin
MDKVGRPRGLIRYASENGIENRETLKYTTRMKLYTALLLVLLVILTTLLVTRKDVDATIMRTPGMLYQERGNDSISNLYNIKVVNKTMADIPLTVRLERADGKVEIIGGGPVIVKQEGQGSGSFFIVLPRKAIFDRKTLIPLGLYEGEKKIAVLKTNFLGPVAP